MPMTPLRDLRTLRGAPHRRCATYGQDNASTISAAADKPAPLKFPTISTMYCRKNASALLT
eukprot:7962982-Pyramimonas_sp.AAC.2